MKQLDWQLRVRDENSVATLQRLGGTADQTNRKLKELANAKPPKLNDDEPGNKLKDIAESLGSGQKRALTHILEGGIAGFAIEKLNEATKKAAELTDQFRKGEITGSEMVGQLARSIPVLGSAIGVFDNIREAITGEKSALEQTQSINAVINDDAKAINKLLVERNAILNDSIELQKKFNEEIQHLQDAERNANLEGRAKEDDARKSRNRDELQKLQDEADEKKKKNAESLNKNNEGDNEALKKLMEKRAEAQKAVAAAQELVDSNLRPIEHSSDVANLNAAKGNLDAIDTELRMHHKARTNMAKDAAALDAQVDKETAQKIAEAKKKQAAEDAEITRKRKEADDEALQAETSKRYAKELQAKGQHDAAMLELQGKHAEAELAQIKADGVAKIAEINAQADAEIKRRQHLFNETEEQARKKVDPGRQADIQTVQIETSDKLATTQKKAADDLRNHQDEINKKQFTAEEKFLQARVELSKNYGDKIAATQKLQAFELKKNFEEAAADLRKLMVDPHATDEQKKKGMSQLQQIAELSGDEYQKKIQEALGNEKAGNPLAKADTSMSLTGVSASAGEKAQVDLFRQTAKAAEDSKKIQQDMLALWTQFVASWQQKTTFADNQSESIF